MTYRSGLVFKGDDEIAKLLKLLARSQPTLDELPQQIQSRIRFDIFLANAERGGQMYTGDLDIHVEELDYSNRVVVAWEYK